MGNFTTTLVFFFFLISLISSSYAQNCSSYVLNNRNSNRLTSCNNLPVLNASIHWNYNPNDRTVDIAYRHTGMTRSNWIAWSLNPTGRGMIGAQALVAFFNSSGALHAYTSPITAYGTTLQEAPLSFQVPSIAAEFTNNNQIMTIYATIQLPQGSTTRFTQVWQHGDVSGNIPQSHTTTRGSDHLRSSGTIDFATAAAEQPITPSPPTTTTAPPATTSGENNCPAYTFSNRIYRDCSSLPVLSSFLHWNYNQGNRTVDIAYRHTGMTRSNWIAWSLNPTGQGMIGAQALVAFFNSSGAIHAYTSPITAYRTTLQEGPLSFQVPSIAAEFTNNDQMIIYATIVLPEGSTSFTQVWQHGDVSGTTPQIHPTSRDHLSSISRIDFATGATSGGAAVGGSRQRKRNVHGVLNVVSWGILMPLGAMAARYMKVFKSANPAWFYLHVACQCSAYIVGVAGWGTGIKLGSDSAGVEHDTHRNIGITLFALGTLQVFALLLRPKPDHKYRFYWNIYHYAIGYTVISLSIANIFEGFDILDPEKKWKRAYIGVLIFMGATALVLEAFTWFIVIKRKRESAKNPPQQNGNGNGYHA